MINILPEEFRLRNEMDGRHVLAYLIFMFAFHVMKIYLSQVTVLPNQLTYFQSTLLFRPYLGQFHFPQSMILTLQITNSLYL